MIGELVTIWVGFNSCFSRRSAYHWFIITLFGFIVRLDHHGITSHIRWLKLKPKHYETFLAFFRADSWALSHIIECWAKTVEKISPIIKLNGSRLLIGDGIKLSKEASNMPGVKKLHQESDNSGKSEWIFGHHFGVIGILAGKLNKLFCVPLAAEIHEGVETLRLIQGKDAPELNEEPLTTIGTLMVSLAIQVSASLGGTSILVLDAYFSTGSVFLLAKTLVSETGERLLHVITRAKSNVVGYEEPPSPTGKSGRPRKYGKKFVLQMLFQEKISEFKEVVINVYGVSKTVSYLCLDLIWKPIGEKVRFVLVQDGENKFILMCSDLTLSATDIITAYSYRFKIEVSFKMLKHLLGGFYYHFWTKACSFTKEQVKSLEMGCLSKKSIDLIGNTLNAIEAFVNFAAIALGTLQILSLICTDKIWSSYKGWLRTYSSSYPSEETVKTVIQYEFYHNFEDFNDNGIIRIIQSKQKEASNAEKQSNQEEKSAMDMFPAVNQPIMY